MTSRFRAPGTDHQGAAVRLVKAPLWCCGPTTSSRALRKYPQLHQLSTSANWPAEAVGHQGQLARPWRTSCWPRSDEITISAGRQAWADRPAVSRPDAPVRVPRPRARPLAAMSGAYHEIAIAAAHRHHLGRGRYLHAIGRPPHADPHPKELRTEETAARQTLARGAVHARARSLGRR